MSELKLEAGKFYRTRMGIKAKLMGLMGDQWFGAILSDSGRWLERQWHESGKFDPVAGKCSMDLIAEWNDDDDWGDVDPTKITLSMLPLEARFRNELTEDWRYSKVNGYWANANRYQCAATDWWDFCQVKKEIQK